MAEEGSRTSVTSTTGSPVPSPPLTRRASHGEIAADVTDGRQSVETSKSSRSKPQSLRPVTGTYGSIASAKRATSPDPSMPSNARQAAMLRRTSSKQLPHRGQEFSVDDAMTEVDEDEPPKLARHASGSTRRVGTSTIRRRTTAQPPRLMQINSTDDEDADIDLPNPTTPAEPEARPPSSGEEGTTQADADDREELEDDDEDLSDTESFTLKDRQEAINETHPFGIRIWKSALYKKARSVEKDAEGDIHSTPGGYVSRWLWFCNFAWTILFGWWLAAVAAFGALLCHLLAFAPGCTDYGKVLWGFATYIFYPFGKYIKLIQDEAYAEEDEGEGRSISEYEQWQSGDLEEGRLFFGPVRSLIGRRRSEEDSDDEGTSLLGRGRRGQGSETAGPQPKRRLFGRGQWNPGRILFFFIFYGLLTPLLFVVWLICWFLIFTIPMAKVAAILFDHLRRHPLALEFHHDTTYTRGPGSSPSSMLLCTYRAVGLKYWKYTLGGTNIILINLLGLVAFAIFDYWVLYKTLQLQIPITNTFFVFLLALFSIIPLAYFIGQAVASISAQSTMGVGAAVNAFFSTIVEVFLYCVALNEGKAQLVEGSVIGSIFAGILFLPGLSMCFGAIKRKTQRFNVKSAGVTSTMLLFAMIGAFSPTLFYQIYGAHQLNCHECTEENAESSDRDCRRCFFAQIPAIHDPFYTTAILPYVYFAAVLLFLSYVIGLLFTLRTHAAVIWNSEIEEKKHQLDSSIYRTSTHKPPSVHDFGATLVRQTTVGSLKASDIRESQLYKKILGQSLKQAGMLSPTEGGAVETRQASSTTPGRMTDATIVNTPSVLEGADKSFGSLERPTKSKPTMKVPGFSEEDNQTLMRQMAEMAATAATVATQEAVRAPRKPQQATKTSANHENVKPTGPRAEAVTPGVVDDAALVGEAVGGHDAPNWSRMTSYAVLIIATVAYAVIAEILVNTVDAVLDNVDIDEKFLGITLFALVPNTTEFLNAISFAMNGNIALSMEIGSAYALQVCLLQIPALVLFSGVYGRWIDGGDSIDHVFTLIFPQWDMVTVILCVFLLSYMYGEGKSNYFKGSILILSYLVVIVGFYLSGFDDTLLEEPGNSRITMLRAGGQKMLVE